MSIKLPKSVLFGIAFLVAFFLYWPLINGTPIWDDLTYWFDDRVMVPDFPYLDFWKRFTWPLSNTVQKFLLSIWGENYTYYHVLCVFIHFANSYLVYLLGKEIKFNSPFLLFLLFLLSPVSVITAGWLIQIKTLMCFFFGISALLTWLKSFVNPKWIVPSWLLFVLCVAAKSALITLPGIIVLVSLKKLRGKKFLLILPFFLISSYGAYRILYSPVTQKAVNKLAPARGDETEPVNNKPAALLDSTPQEVQFVARDFFLLTSYYYFWQSILPLDTTPVKGSNFSRPGWVEALHVVFLIFLIILFWKDQILIFLIAAHVLLIPFVGIIPAPFMMVTWVSDQHLYAVLPAFYLMWIAMMDKLKVKHLWLIHTVLLILFSYKTYQTSKYYKNEFSFYEKSLEYNPTNFVIAYNLAFANMKVGEFDKALKIVESSYVLVQTMPELKRRRFYDNLMHLYFILKFPVTEKK